MKCTNLSFRRCRGQRYALGDRGRPRCGSRLVIRRDPHGARSGGDPACQNIPALRVSRLAGTWACG